MTSFKMTTPQTFSRLLKNEGRLNEDAIWRIYIYIYIFWRSLFCVLRIYIYIYIYIYISRMQIRKWLRGRHFNWKNLPLKRFCDGAKTLQGCSFWICNDHPSSTCKFAFYVYIYVKPQHRTLQNKWNSEQN